MELLITRFRSSAPFSNLTIGSLAEENVIVLVTTKTTRFRRNLKKEVYFFLAKGEG